MMHDLSYQYGFTEAAGNFQNVNFGKGGVEGDPVIATVQDPWGVNNAAFFSPPDGQSGELKMYLFDCKFSRKA
jgi:extracellular elastinolytic metalloproteinase